MILTFACCDEKSIQLQGDFSIKEGVLNEDMIDVNYPINVPFDSDTVYFWHKLKVLISESKRDNLNLLVEQTMAKKWHLWKQAYYFSHFLHDDVIFEEFWLEQSKILIESKDERTLSLIFGCGDVVTDQAQRRKNISMLSHI